MSIILDGEWIRDDLTKNANGGTESIIKGMLKYIPNKKLKGWQIIHSRLPDFLSDDHKTMVVFHDMPADPMYDKLLEPSYVAKIDKFVFVSYWQMERFILQYGISYDKSTVIQNFIDSFELRKAERDINHVNLIYHTTPHRGLDLLMASFESIYEIDKDISLDIYSSFEIYGWKDRDKPYEKLFEKAKNHEGIRYHGYQPNEVVRKALKKSHIFAYPCTWSETSCISAIEALCSGNVVICPRYGALPETCGMFGIYYDFSPSNVDHANTFVNVLYKSILAMRNQGLNTEFQQMLYNKFYDWKTNAHLWKNILEDK